MRARIVKIMEIKFAELFQIESEIRNNKLLTYNMITNFCKNI